NEVDAHARGLGNLFQQLSPLGIGISGKLTAVRDVAEDTAIGHQESGLTFWNLSTREAYELGDDLVPGFPEKLHLIRKAERNPQVSQHRRKRTADVDSSLAKFFAHRFCRFAGFNHHKICVAWDDAQLAASALPHELGAVGYDAPRRGL